jgi:3-isopropylmalate/(R)-2-methylmalate dehydratase small subunit
MTDSNTEFVRRGRCWVFGDNVCNDGDMIPFHFVPVREQRPQILKDHSMTGLDPEFPRKAAPGDLVIAGRRFAQGNAHIQAFFGLKGLGLSVAVESIPRSSLRNCVSAGVLILPECPGITSTVATGDEVEIDFSTGRLVNHTRNNSTRIYQPLDAALLTIIQKGGWEAHFRDRLSRQRSAPAV